MRIAYAVERLDWLKMSLVLGHGRRFIGRKSLKYSVAISFIVPSSSHAVRRRLLKKDR